MAGCPEREFDRDCEECQECNNYDSCRYNEHLDDQADYLHDCLMDDR